MSTTGEGLWDGVTGFFGYGAEPEPTPTGPKPARTDPKRTDNPTRKLDPKKYDIDYLNDVQGTLDHMRNDGEGLVEFERLGDGEGNFTQRGQVIHLTNQLHVAAVERVKISTQF